MKGTAFRSILKFLSNRSETTFEFYPVKWPSNSKALSSYLFTKPASYSAQRTWQKRVFHHPSICVYQKAYRNRENLSYVPLINAILKIPLPEEVVHSLTAYLKFIFKHFCSFCLCVSKTWTRPLQPLQYRIILAFHISAPDMRQELPSYASYVFCNQRRIPVHQIAITNLFRQLNLFI